MNHNIVNGHILEHAFKAGFNFTDLINYFFAADHTLCNNQKTLVIGGTEIQEVIVIYINEKLSRCGVSWLVRAIATV